MKDALLRFAIEVPKDQVNIPQGELVESNIRSALQLTFGVAGGIAVLIITLAAFRYVYSMGNPEQAAKAKNGIVYALIGLLVCLVAYSVVTFVLDEI